MNTPSQLKSLSLPMKGLISAFLLTLGAGYLISLMYLFLIDVEPHQKMGMNVLQGTIHKYYGRRGDTRLEGVLRGSMGAYLTDPEKKQISAWVEAGTPVEGFTRVKPIFEKSCVSCHSPSAGLGLIPLTTYEEVKAVTNVDLGESIKTLARVSHIHILCFGFISISTGLVFSLSSMGKYTKLVIVLVPFFAIWLDIGSWWFTKYKPVFAYAMIIGGGLMALSLAVQISVSIYEMWFKRTGRIAPGEPPPATDGVDQPRG